MAPAFWSPWGARGPLCKVPQASEQLELVIPTQFWFHDHKLEVGSDCCLAVLRLGESCRGVCRLPTPRRRLALPEVSKNNLFVPSIGMIMSLPLPLPCKHLQRFPNSQKLWESLAYGKIVFAITCFTSSCRFQEPLGNFK